MNEKDFLHDPNDIRDEKEVQAIYYNNIANCIACHCDSAVGQFKSKKRFDLKSYEIAKELVTQFILAHYMDNTGITLEKETQGKLVMERDVEWSARKLKLNSNYPLIPQLVNSICPQSRKTTSLASSSAMTQKRPDIYMIYDAKSDRVGHYHKRHHSFKNYTPKIFHSPHSHHKCHNKGYVLDEASKVYHNNRLDVEGGKPVIEVNENHCERSVTGSDRPITNTWDYLENPKIEHPLPYSKCPFKARIDNMIRSDAQLASSVLGENEVSKYLASVSSQAASERMLARSYEATSKRRSTPSIKSQNPDKAKKNNFITSDGDELAPTVEIC